MATTTPQIVSAPRAMRRSTFYVVLLLICQAAACYLSAGPSLTGRVDLRAFYGAGLIVHSGHASQLYDYEYQGRVQDVVAGQRAGALPFLYPPFAALLFVPLSLVTYRSAFYILLIVNIALLAGAARLLSPWLPQRHGRGWFFLPALYACFFSVIVALMQGQISIVLLVVYCGSYVLLKQQRPLVAGLLCSIGLMKFQLALPVLFLFVVWKKWRFVAGFLSGGLCLGGVSWAMIGSAGLVSYWHSMWHIAGATAVDPLAAKARYGMFPTSMPNLHGFTFALSNGAHWGQLLNIVLCCAVLGWAARQRASMLVALPAAMLVSYHMQPHDLTLLLLPLTFACNDLLLRPRLLTPRKVPHVHSRVDAVLVAVLLALILPFAYLALVKDFGWVVSIAVASIMVIAATDPRMQRSAILPVFEQNARPSICLG